MKKLNENDFDVELPGLKEAQLILTDQPGTHTLTHVTLRSIFGNDSRLQRFAGKSVPLYTGRITLWYGTEKPDLIDVLDRVFPPQLRRRMKYLYEKEEVHTRHIYLFEEPMGKLESVTISLPGIVAARRLSETRNGSQTGHLCINDTGKGEQYLHYGRDGTLLFVRMPTQKEPGLILLLSKYVVDTIIAGYALALVGPHRAWLATLLKTAP